MFLFACLLEIVQSQTQIGMTAGQEFQVFSLQFPVLGKIEVFWTRMNYEY
jgi:hypothetical protein